MKQANNGKGHDHALLDAIGLGNDRMKIDYFQQGWYNTFIVLNCVE